MRFAHANLPRAKNRATNEYSSIARDAVLAVAPSGDEVLLFYGWQRYGEPSVDRVSLRLRGIGLGIVSRPSSRSSIFLQILIFLESRRADSNR